MSAMASLAQLDGVFTASALSTANAAAGTPAGTTPAGTTPAGDIPAGGGREVLPTRAELAAVLPWHGLRRGSTVAVHESTSLLLGLLSAATENGSWAALVGMPWVNPLAAAEMGADAQRMAAVPRPGDDVAGVVAALLDGVDMVVVGSPNGLSERDAHRLSARARHRGAVLLPFGAWPGAEVELWCTGAVWCGPEEGHGRLRERSVTVRTRGRGAAARPRSRRVTLPARDGGIGIADETVPWRERRSAGRRAKAAMRAVEVPSR